MKTFAPLLSLCLLGACYGRVDVVARDVPATDSVAADAADGGVCVGGVPTLLSGIALLANSAGGCLPRRNIPSHTEPTGSRLDCVLIERSPTGATLACDPAHGRLRHGTSDCIVTQLTVPTEATAPASGHGFYGQHGDVSCETRVAYTPGDEPAADVVGTLECRVQYTADRAVTPATCHGAVGATCHPMHPGNDGPCTRENPAGCFLGTERYLETNNIECAQGTCLVDRYNELGDTTGAERAARVGCTCRCAGLSGVTDGLDPASLCACPSGYSCEPIAGAAFGAAAGSYCVRVR